MASQCLSVHATEATVIEKVGNKHVLRSKKTGKVLGTHSSYKKALAQERAIQVAKKKKSK
jgi:hypothetical protein